jgi:hypothetical protein
MTALPRASEPRAVILSGAKDRGAQERPPFHQDLSGANF